MFELPPILLALAFIVVGAAAWYLGRRTAASNRTVRLPPDYYVGLDHLINDRFDSAAEVFSRMAQGDNDATEIQFALGSLFRRRGEVDRAIAIHTRLRDEGPATSRDRAAFALALDYLGAGLMDRAEQLLEQLTASGEFRAAALDQLVRIYEQQGDWANALKFFHELSPSVQLERRKHAAHYLCELAEQALLQGDMDRTRTLLRQARVHDAELPRAEVVAARVTEASGDQHGALCLYLKALEVSPGLALEVIPRVLVLARQLNQTNMLEDLAVRIQHAGHLNARQLAWLLATAVPAAEVNNFPRIIADELGAGTDVAPADVSSVSAMLTRIGDVDGRYQCDDCGLHSVGWYWRCPKCRSWDSMRPAVFKWAGHAT